MVEVLPVAEGKTGLLAFLSARARNASNTRILLDICVGVVAVYVALFARPAWENELRSAGWVLFSFGFWALFERMKSPSDDAFKRRLRVGGQILLAISGVVSAAMLIFLLWARSIGTWIS
jgi:hypothetical protein